MTVAELVTLLQSFPQDAPVGTLIASRTGVATDVETAPVRTVEQTISDDGAALAVWITGVGPHHVRPPSLITWPCPCGEIITMDIVDVWPVEHDAHLNQEGRAR